MAQALQIEPTVFDDVSTVATTPEPVAVMQPLAVTQPHPAWYLTPVVVLPVAAAAFIIGNVLMMIPWQVL